MDFKNFIKFSGDKSSFKKLSRNFSDCWICHQQIVFILLMLISAAAGLYFWYKINYQSEWDQEKKKQFVLSQEREINFREAEFKKVLEEIERKKTEFNSESQPAKDIFKPF